MSLILKIAAYFIGNIFGLLVSSRYLSGFILSDDPKEILILTALLVAGNVFLKPVLKLIFSPIIFLTIGLFTMVINTGILYIIDFISDYITINGISALLYGTLIISISNLITRWSAGLFIKENQHPSFPHAN